MLYVYNVEEEEINQPSYAKKTILWTENPLSCSNKEPNFWQMSLKTLFAYQIYTDPTHKIVPIQFPRYPSYIYFSSSNIQMMLSLTQSNYINGKEKNRTEHFIWIASFSCIWNAKAPPLWLFLNWIQIEFLFDFILWGLFFSHLPIFLTKGRFFSSMVCKLNLNKLLVFDFDCEFYGRMGWKHRANSLFLCCSLKCVLWCDCLMFLLCDSLSFSGIEWISMELLTF